MQRYLGIVSFCALAAALAAAIVLAYNTAEIVFPGLALDNWRYTQLIEAGQGTINTAGADYRIAMLAERHESIKAALKAGLTAGAALIVFLLHFIPFKRNSRPGPGAP